MNVNHKKRLLIVLRYIYLIALVCMIAAIIILQARNHRIQLERIAVLEAELKTVRQEMQEMREEIVQQITLGTDVTGERILETNNRIQRLNSVYAAILSTQQRRTLDSLYNESELIKKKKEAERLFKEKNYAAAREQYAVVAQARPEDIEARFYQWYSLFLINKMDVSNYKQIKEELKRLEQNGYHRAEISEVLEYIETEEGGMPEWAENIQ